MSGSTLEAASLVVLVAALGFAVVRPAGLSEALLAAPGAALLVAIGALPWSAARRTCLDLLPTVVFLCLILLFGHLCADRGVFRYLAGLAARGARGDARRLLLLVVGLAALVTAVLTLDATVVLLSPVIAATVAQLAIDSRGPLYACVRLANSASLLLPVSNLTNLLAFPHAQRSFGGFAAVMALPWLVAVVLEWAALRIAFPPTAEPIAASLDESDGGGGRAAPRYPLLVLALALVGFVVASAAGVSPAWAAGGAAAALGIPALIRRRTSPAALVRELNLGFGVFVLALGVIVEAVARHGVASGVARLLPAGSGLLALLGVAALAAALANLVNNIPATLVLLPLLQGRPAAVLAMLIGVNVGPNATYSGSLATLLWRRQLPAAMKPSAAQFHRLGLLATPVVLVACTVALWAALRLGGQ